MGLIKKKRPEKEVGVRREKVPFIFTVLMVILFGLIVFVMLLILVALTTYYDMESVTSYVERHHSYYQKQERKYLSEICQEYKNMCLLMKSEMQENISAEEMIKEVELVSFFSEKCLILDKEGKVVYPADWAGPDFSEKEMAVLAGGDKSLIRVDEGVHKIYYSGGLKDGDRTIVLEDSNVFIDDLMKHRVSWKAQCENVKIGYRGVVVPLSKSSGQLYYIPEGMEKLKNSHALDNLEDDLYSFVTIGNRDYLCFSRIMADNDTVLTALYPVKDLISLVLGTTVICALIFALAMGVILVYVMTLIRLRKKGERVYRWKKLPGGFVYDRRAGRPMMLYASLILISMAILTFYFLTLIGISTNSARASGQLKQVVQSYDKAYQDPRNAEEFIKEKREVYLRMLLVLNVDDDTVIETLSELQRESDNIYSLSYYDVNGKLLYSSNPSVGQINKEEKENFAEIKKGISNNFSYISDVKGGGDVPEYRNVVVLTLKDGEASGFIVTKIAENRLPADLKRGLLTDELFSVKTGNGGSVFAVEHKSNIISFDASGKLVGKDALKCGLDPEDLQSGFSGYLTLNGVQKYAVSVLEKSQYIYLAMEEWEMLINRLPTVGINLIAGVICIFFLFIYVTIRRKREGDILDEEDEEKERGVRNSAHSVHVVAVMKGIIFATAAIVTLIHLFYNVLLPESSIFYYIFEGNWDKGLNIFSYTICLVTICESIVVIELLSRLLRLIAEILSRRGETICRLLISLIKYLGILVVIFMCIANCGVNMRTLAVSAGIMGTVLGLGTTSLLSDIFAGLFMTFEGDMQVGDAMIIDNFLGRIVEIGIRTTKFIDSDENTLIVNNHMLMGPVKRARTYNYCHSFIYMDYDESLDRVEAFLAAELPGLKEKLPFLLSEPEYRGVVSLLDQHVKIDIRYKASAVDRFMAEREMNRELKLIFDKYQLSLNITEDYRMTDIVYLPKEEGDTEASIEFLKKRWKGRAF